MRRIRVMFTGFEPFWMKVAVEGLMKRYGDELDCRWMIWPSTPRERVRFVGAVLRSDLVVRLGMPFEFQSETNRFFLLMLQLIPRLQGANYWIGSDAALFLARKERGELTERDLDAVTRMHHFAGTQHLQEILREAGVPAVDAELIGPERDIPAVVPPFEADFRVLSYWNDPRFEYCGGPEVLEAARLMPDVHFDVLGSDGISEQNVSSNVTFHGRVDDVIPYIKRSVVYVRLIAGDSLPSSLVEEVLLLGRYAIYSLEWPNTILLPRCEPQQLVEVLRDLQARHARNELPLNLEGRRFTAATSNPDAQASKMHEAILNAYAHPLRGTRGRPKVRGSSGR